ncbi:hypothetical protein GCM10022234_15740 [Aeromicrobium panaciterrae]|uniref:DUF416 family protein n=1 Tax=Aeromicrobium panaciterrae TaxID=363861 RepID=UPI0031D0985A
MYGYDEGVLHARLGQLDRTQKTVFAAACAQRAEPLFRRFVETSGLGDVDILHSVLENVWTVAAGDPLDLHEDQRRAEDQVPIEDDSWIIESGYGQNAAACTAYAVRTWLTDDPQEAVWAARQIYEVADYAAQNADASIDLNDLAVESRLLATAIVQSALRGIDDDLGRAESDLDILALRDIAMREGLEWSLSFP